VLFSRTDEAPSTCSPRGTVTGTAAAAEQGAYSVSRSDDVADVWKLRVWHWAGLAAVASLLPLRISAPIVSRLAAALASGGAILVADEIKAMNNALRLEHTV